MENNPNQNQESLAQSVKASLRKAEGIAKDRRKINTRLLVTGMTSSSAATLVAGITAAGGPVIGTGIEGWRVACIIAAVFGFTSTISTGLGQQLKTNDRLSQATLCVGKLRALDVMITTGSRSWEENIAEFKEIAQLYPEFIG